MGLKHAKRTFGLLHTQHSTFSLAEKENNCFSFFFLFFWDIYVRYDVNVGDPPAKVNLPLNWDATTVTLHCFVSFCATKVEIL